MAARNSITPARWAFAGAAGGAAAGAEMWLAPGAGLPEAAAGCAVVQVAPAALAAVAARLRSTPVRVAARIAGPGALASTRLFDAGECLRLGADEIAWPLDPGQEFRHLDPTIAAAAAACHAAGARLKLLAANPSDGPAEALVDWARRCGADSLALPVTAAGAPAGAIAEIIDL